MTFSATTDRVRLKWTHDFVFRSVDRDFGESLVSPSPRCFRRCFSRLMKKTVFEISKVGSFQEGITRVILCA